MYRDNLPIEAVHKLQDLLELQPQEECNHVSDWMVYTSNPPKYKCKKCGYMTTEYMAQEEKTEETIEEKMVNISKRIWNNKHEQSILQKLRAELERIIKWCEVCDDEPAEYHSLVKLRFLLNELEKEQPPAPEELKLEKLPELNLKWDTEYQRDSAMIDQFNLLTTTVNLLIDKLNNK